MFLYHPAFTLQSPFSSLTMKLKVPSVKCKCSCWGCDEWASDSWGSMSSPLALCSALVGYSQYWLLPCFWFQGRCSLERARDTFCCNLLPLQCVEGPRIQKCSSSPAFFPRPPKPLYLFVKFRASWSLASFHGKVRTFKATIKNGSHYFHAVIFWFTKDGKIILKFKVEPLADSEAVIKCHMLAPTHWKVVN